MTCVFGGAGGCSACMYERYDCMEGRKGGREEEEVELSGRIEKG